MLKAGLSLLILLSVAAMIICYFAAATGYSENSRRWFRFAGIVIFLSAVCGAVAIAVFVLQGGIGFLGWLATGIAIWPLYVLTAYGLWCAGRTIFRPRPS